jgi:hypothetical protein
MVLLINSPDLPWMLLCWFIRLPYKSTTIQIISTTTNKISQAARIGPSGYECISEYTCFVVFTAICFILKIVMQCAWLPITGLLWWYRFYRNIIDDASGRSIMDIFRSPNQDIIQDIHRSLGNPQQHINEEKKQLYTKLWRCFTKDPLQLPLPENRKRHPRPFRKRFPGTPGSAQIPSCFLPIDHRENRKKKEYFEIDLPPTPLVSTIDGMLNHIWAEHSNSEFYHSMHTILLSLWFCIGFRFWKLLYMLFIQLQARIIGMIFREKLKPPNLWIFYKRHRQRGRQKKYRNRWTRTVYTSVYNVDDKLTKSNCNSMFDTDADFVVCDNSANTHICNNKAMFVTFEETTKGMVATIGGKLNRPGGIGTVEWTWKDDTGESHTERLDNVLFFPQSPINIMSVTEFAKQLDDEEGTGIDTKMKYSRFYWKQNKYSRKIYHSASNLPELAINEGNTLYSWFTKKFGTRVDDTINPTCCFTNSDHDNHCCVTIDRGKPDDTTFIESIIYPGEKLIYKNEGDNAVVKIIDSNLDKDGMLRYTIEFASGERDQVPREYLVRPDTPDIASIPITIPDIQEAARQLSVDEVDSILHPNALSPAEQEFLDLHHRLFHLPYSVMFRLAKVGFLPKYLLRLKDRPPPCASCLFGAQHRSNWRSRSSKHGKKSILRKEDLSGPGQCVGVDQMISAQPGLVPQDKGNLTRGRIWACTIFIDYFTGFTFVALMRDLTAESTLAAKKEFEHKCAVRGVRVKHYHADNGRFAEPAFVNECKRCKQDLTFCGVGAHHQNGIAERKIKDVTLISRTILLHAMRYWPEYVTQMMWPFAAMCAQERMNNLHINLDGESPDMRFSNVKAVNVQLKHYHTFGCPVYILDSRLQTNPKGVPKWEPRSRLGIYVGHSPVHAGSVALVLNPKTGLVSPQFHVVYDDNFTTVPHMRNLTVPSNWAQLVKNSSELITTEQYDLTKTWFEGQDDPSADTILQPTTDDAVSNLHGRINQSQANSMSNNEDAATTPNEGDAVTTSNEGDAISKDDISSTEYNFRNLRWTDDSDQQSQTRPDVTAVSEGDEILGMPSIVNLQESGLRRSPRIAQLNSNASSSFSRKSVLATIFCFGSLLLNPAAALESSAASAYTTVQSIAYQFDEVNMNFDNTCNDILHHVYSAAKESNESYTFKEMLRQDDRDQFVEAMQKEIDDHTKRKHWEIILRSEMPKDTKTIMAIWSFKRKRFPDGTLNKHKARLCAHGGQQQWGVNYWETYAPVVNWISVRFLLIISQLAGLETQALDFVLAFPQADLDVPVFMKLPPGIDVGKDAQKDAYVISLKSSLYGLKQSSANWYECLKKGLERRGFTESKSDPCVFLKKDMIILTYVDDCILISNKKEMLDQFIHSLANGIEKFEFTDEGAIDKYLGVEVVKLKNKEFILRQPFLIQRILTALNVTEGDYNSRDVPVIGPLLSRDEKGAKRKHEWSYRSAIGMLGYLQASTRPDISMAVHQCARFNANPMLCHEKAVKYIARYLLTSMDKGIHYKPDATKGLECYVDADFAGGWSSGDHSNPECVLSRTGFVIMYAGCPLTWCSKLQTEIALSTTESEYIALSQAMREVIPFMNLMMEVGDVFPLNNTKPKLHCKVFEDNNSCIRVAESPKFTPRTKHIAIKYHHFRKHVADKTIAIFPIDTKDQLADIFTKPLDRVIFTKLRKELMGW